MKMFYHQLRSNTANIEEDLTPVNLMDSIQKTQQALDNAYSGFENALEADLIDSYIFEINALQKKYKYLVDLYAPAGETKTADEAPEPLLQSQANRRRKPVLRRDVSPL